MGQKRHCRFDPGVETKPVHLDELRNRITLPGPELEVLDFYGSGDVDLTAWELEYGHEKVCSLADTKLKTVYLALTDQRLFKKHDGERTEVPSSDGLERHKLWLRSAGAPASWYKPVFTAIRTPLITAEERDLLWLFMHGALMVGSRLRGMGAEDTWRYPCPLCGDDANGVGETHDHAFGTCTELPMLWDWLVENFLRPMGALPAITRATEPLKRPGHRPLTGVVTPSIAAGILGAIRPAVMVKRPPPGMHALWTMIRGITMRVLAKQRLSALNYYKNHRLRVHHPPLKVLKERILAAIRSRVMEELSLLNVYKREKNVIPAEKLEQVSSRILYGNVLGRYDEAVKAIVLHVLLGGDRIPLHIIKDRKLAPEQLPAPAEGTPCTVFFDGASKKNPGREGAGTVLYGGSLVNVEPLDNTREFLGLRSSNQAEYCAVILGLHRAKTLGFTSVYVKGDSKLVIKQLSGEWICRQPELKRYYRTALKLAKDFPHGVHYEWIPRSQNQMADAQANLAVATGLPHDRGPLFTAL